MEKDNNSLPQSIGPYKISKLLGSGDFADTYKGEDVSANSAAVKLSRIIDGDAVERLRVETDALRRFAHPVIPRYIGEGQHDERPYLAMSLAQGTTLREIWQRNRQTNRRLSDWDALSLAIPLFDALAYLHAGTGKQPGWVHRDIKDANVMANPSWDSITLIDFGFCKEDEAQDRRLSDSFFRAGAARYSPPAKLSDPNRAVASHDIFAVGVLLYQLLSNEFPWTTRTGAVGELRRMMLQERPRRLDELNNTVRREVTEFVHQLIQTDESYRPTARQALERSRSLLESLSVAAASFGPTRSIQFGNVWRDPIYGDIWMTDEEFTVIDSPEMQRLRSIQQLGLANVSYESARHTRLGHAVGTLGRVEQVLSSLEQTSGVRIDAETRLSARLYGLVHDVTHIALGHTLEDEFAFFTRHDENSRRIDRFVLDSSTSALARILASSDHGREVQKQFDPSSTVHGRSDVGELISGPVGADMLDYIDRDSYFCGLDQRVDSAFLRQLRLSPRRGEIESHVVSLVNNTYGVRLDREYALEALYRDRYALFLKVYSHKTKIKASVLVGKALTLALQAGRKPALTEVEIELMTDEELIWEIGHRRRQNERERKLIDALRFRRLPKAVYRATLLREDERTDTAYRELQNDLSTDGPLGVFPAARRLETEETLARLANMPADDVFIYVSASAPGYKKTQQHRFLVDERSGQTAEPSAAWFTRLKQRHLALWDLWVFAAHDSPERSVQLLADACEDRFGRANRAGVSAREDTLF